LARNRTISEQTTGKDHILEFIDIDGATLKSSKIALGTWAIGGWVWGGTIAPEAVEESRRR
jgi:hypothetical protein